jgi:hypothetical protein
LLAAQEGTAQGTSRKEKAIKENFSTPYALSLTPYTFA